MILEAQSVAIAEACGIGPYDTCWKDEVGIIWGADVGRIGRTKIPNYPNDLNAMAAAERTLDEKTRLRYLTKLVTIVGRDRDSNIAGNINAAIFATAEQRAEAFLRALNLWEDEP